MSSRQWYEVDDCCGKPPRLVSDFYDCGKCRKYRFECRVCGATTEWQDDIHSAVEKWVALKWEALLPSRKEIEPIKTLQQLMKDLRPCPFCGKEVIPTVQNEYGISRYEGLPGEELAYFHCPSCDTDVYIDTPYGNRGKIEQWNARTEGKNE